MFHDGALMRSRTLHFVGILGLAMTFAAVLASAQDPDPQSQSQPQQDPQPQPPAGKNPKPVPAGRTWGGWSTADNDATAERQYIILGSDQEYSLDPSLRHRFIYGVDLTEGYDDGVVSFPERAGTSYTLVMPTVGIIGRTKKSQYIVQYSPTISYFTNFGSQGVQAYHQGSAEIHTEVNREWGWDFVLATQDGTYPLSLLSEFNFSSLDGVVAVDPNSTLLLSNTGYFNMDATLGFHYNLSPRDTITVSTDYTYTVFDQSALPGSAGGHVQRLNTVLLYSHAVTRRFHVNANGNVQHTFGALDCTIYGGQLGASYEIKRGTSISGSVGPEFGNGSCSGSTEISYTGAFTSRVSRNWEVYLSAVRTQEGPVHSSLGTGQTETYGGGVARKAGRLDLRADGGYIRVGALAGVPNSFDANGTYISPKVSWHFTPSLTLSFIYQRILQTVNDVDANRNQVSATLQWQPSRRGTY